MDPLEQNSMKTNFSKIWIKVKYVYIRNAVENVFLW